MIFFEENVALRETIPQKVARRDEQAKIMLQIIELSKKLEYSTSELADVIKYPKYISDNDIERLRRDIDRRFWTETLNECQVEKFLTTTDKEKLFDQMNEKTPVFEESAVYDMVASFRNSKEATALNMIKKIHREVTDTIFRVGNNHKNENEKRIQKGVPKMFRATVFYGKTIPSYVGGMNSRFEFIVDLDRALHLCDDKVQPDYQQSIISKTDLALRNKETFVTGDYFTLQIYKNGNVKITITNDEVLKTFNKWGRKENTLE